MTRADAVVVGAGLAGATAALALAASRRVVWVEATGPAAGASGAAAGLVNPYMGRKARPAWRQAQALDALARAADAAGAEIRRTGILRPARSPAQAAIFRERAAAHAELEWLGVGAVAERFPLAAAPFGGLWVRRGASVDVPSFVRALAAEAGRRGAETVRARLTGWRPFASQRIMAETTRGDIEARHLVLALGDGARDVPALADLPLHRVKGQTVTLAASLPATHPAIAGAGYVVPGAEVIAGTTFEHAFASPDPDPARDAELVAKAVALVPSLAGAAVLGRRAGVRLTLPTSVSPRRLPLAGPLPGHPGVWVVTALGAKGLLTAPLIAAGLADALDGRRRLPHELWPPAIR